VLKISLNSCHCYFK